MTNYEKCKETLKNMKGLNDEVIFNVIEEWFETEVISRDEALMLWNRR